MGELKRIERGRNLKPIRRRQADPRRRLQPTILRKAMAIVGLCVLLTGASFAVAYVGAPSVAYLLRAD